MSTTPVVLQGTVKPDGTLELEGKVPLPAGKVKVTLEPVLPEENAAAFLAFLEGIRAARAKAGLPTRSREDIDAQIRQVRDEFDEQVEEIGRLQDECRRQRIAAEAAEKEAE